MTTRYSRRQFFGLYHDRFEQQGICCNLDNRGIQNATLWFMKSLILKLTDSIDLPSPLILTPLLSIPPAPLLSSSMTSPSSPSIRQMTKFIGVDSSNIITSYGSPKNTQLQHLGVTTQPENRPQFRNLQIGISLGQHSLDGHNNSDNNQHTEDNFMTLKTNSVLLVA